jgi:hypothetical protein
MIRTTFALAGAALLGLLAVRPGGAAGEQDPMKEPLALLARAKQAYAKVDDYTCTLTKRETIHDELTPRNVIALDVRKSPFSVFMRWKSPSSLAGQEVCYVAGQNAGKMRVKPAGWLGLVGWVSIGLNDPRARKTSNYPITDIGIGALIDKFSSGWKLEQRLGKTQVQIHQSRYAGRPCTRVTLTHPTRAGGRLLNYRNMVYFDQKTHLPVGVLNYDWPEEAGGAAPLLEEFRYSDLRLNVGLADSVFDH